jgi:hypothetical protein
MNGGFWIAASMRFMKPKGARNMDTWTRKRIRRKNGNCESLDMSKNADRVEDGTKRARSTDRSTRERSQWRNGKVARRETGSKMDCTLPVARSWNQESLIHGRIDAETKTVGAETVEFGNAR